MMAQKDGAKPFRVAVVGLPSSSPNSNSGAGKSCLCNRFTRSGEDDYSSNHSSVLNHEDFNGPIVNSTHFIYWGQTTYNADDGTAVNFQIIEQTEFCQDGSFNVFSSAQPYLKRAFATKNLPSASGKVAYYGPDQFADIQKYPDPEKFPEKFQIDGFVLCVDMSLNVTMSPLDTQKYFDKLITEALAAKKPLVIAGTKCDRMNQTTLERVQGLLSKNKRQITIVETCSESNVNVDTVFFLLAEQMGKVKFKIKNLSFNDVKKIVVNRKQQADDEFTQLLREMITNCQLTQQQGVEAVRSQQAYRNYVLLCGSSQAKTIVRKHIRRLHDAQVERKKAEFLEGLSHSLSQVIPIVTPSAQMDDLIKDIKSSNKFSQCFIELDNGIQWEDSPVLTSPDKIIPFQFLKCDPEARRVLKDYLTTAQRQYHHRVALEKIISVMESSPLKPGQPLEEQISSLNLLNEFNQLQSKGELNEHYQSWMKKAEADALKDFTELLWEHPELFIARTEEEQKKLESAVDITLGSNILMDDPRFQRLQYRGSKCKAEMLKHLALFAVKKGEIKKCAFQEFIANNVPKQEAVMVDESSPWVLDITDVYYNIALVGKEQICANLKNDIMGLCKASRFRNNDVEYQFQFEIFLPTADKLSNDNFTPQGVIFIVSSDELLVTTENLLKRLFDVSAPYRGLPAAMLFIGEEFLTEDNGPLSVQAVRLSRWLQVGCIAEKWSVFPDRVLTAESTSKLLQGLLERTRHTEAFLRHEMCPEIADMSVTMCTTPDEAYGHEELLPPFLANQLAFYKDDHVLLQVQVEERFYSIAISYQSSTNLESLLSKPLNGYIIVYSSTRKASWKIATFLVGQLPQIPMLLVCVHDGTAGEKLVASGETLARDKEHVMFLNTNDYWQPGCLNEFFTKCWFSRFSSMQKQHVKMNKHLSSRALPSRPQSEMKLRSLPSTPVISSTRPFSSLSSVLSPPAGQLGPLHEILTMENDAAMATYDSADGCVFSKTTEDKRPSSVRDDDILEYASSTTMRQLTNEHKFRSLPRLPISSRAPATNGMYPLASGNRSSDPQLASVYSSVDEHSATSQYPPLEASGQDIYSVVDKSTKRNKPPVDQPIGSSAQSQDIYSVVDKSAKFRRGQSLDELPLSPTGESQGIVHRPGIKKKLVRSPQHQRRQQETSELYSVVQKKTKPVEQEKPEDVYSEISKPTTTNAQQSVGPQHSLPVQEQLYSVVNKPPVKQKPKRPYPEDIYSVVNKLPQTKPKPVKSNSEYSNSNTSSHVEPIPSKVNPADLYAEVKPRQIENGDIYSVVNKPNKPPPVAKKPTNRQRRISSDTSVTMTTTIQEDSQSHDSGVEDGPAIPDRCYDDDELELDDEPPELPPRLYSLSDFDTEDELSFDDILEDFIDERAFENPLYQSITGCKPSGDGGREKPEDSNPLYQTLTSIRKEMDENKPKTDTLKATAQSAKNDKIMERLQRRAEKERVRRLKLEERNRKRQEEAKRRQEQARIREEKKLRKKRAGSRKQLQPTKPYIPPNEAASGKYFGLPLSEVCTNERPIPAYVEQCAQLIEDNGIRQLGIYRVSGKKDDVLDLHAKFDDDPNMDIRPLGVCVNALASGLKSFFKLLPEPLVPEGVCNQLLTVAKSSDEDQLFKLGHVISEMPQINRKILHFLATHLNKIMQEREVNKMNASNLAIVFWPTLMRPPLADLADLSKQIGWQQMMTRIIENPDVSCDPS